MYRLEVITPAQKDLDAFHGKAFELIKKKILSLSSNPRPFGAIKLTQEEGYRIRVRRYRILYRIDGKEKEVIIYRVKHRKEAYR
jgi:mRNA interferase RelE/StbE